MLFVVIVKESVIPPFCLIGCECCVREPVPILDQLAGGDHIELRIFSCPLIELLSMFHGNTAEEMAHSVCNRHKELYRVIESPRISDITD